MPHTLSFIVIGLALIMLFCVVGYPICDRFIRLLAAKRLYKNAPFFCAHELVIKRQKLLEMDQGNLDVQEELTRVEQQLKSYTTILHNCDDQQVLIAKPVYFRLLGAEKLARRQLALAMNDLPSDVRFGEAMSLKVDTERWAEEHQIKPDSLGINATERG